MKFDHINLNSFKMIVSDIDGTLMGKDHVIRDLTKDVAFRLHECGIHFTLATGKNLPATVSQADALEIDLPLILINGAMLQTRQGEVLEQSLLPLDVTETVIEMCERQGKDLVMYINDDILVREMNDNIGKVYSSVKSGIIEVGGWESIADRLPDVNKCLVVDSAIRENLIRIGKEFESAFGGSADVVHASLSLVEVMPKGITKAVGIKKLADSLGVDMCEVIAFGDYDNDIEMLSSVGLGLAVENASPGAKAAARFVIGSVEDEGPAAFLQKLLDR
jgi:Cof subfamily protein (haloacid dehalogenase superfamily)